MKQLNTQLLSKQEVARGLAVSMRRVERLIASGALKRVKIRNTVRIPTSELTRLTGGLIG